MHLSEKNNLPSVAVRTLAEAVGATAEGAAAVRAQTPDGRLSVCVGAQERPLTVW
jgi:hypothetical protein